MGIFFFTRNKSLCVSGINFALLLRFFYLDLELFWRGCIFFTWFHFGKWYATKRLAHNSITKPLTFEYRCCDTTQRKYIFSCRRHPSCWQVNQASFSKPFSTDCHCANNYISATSKMNTTFRRWGKSYVPCLALCR